MRKRLISPEFFQHDGLGSCSLRARLLFVGLWTLCDREGRMRWNSLVVHGQLFPFEREADLDAAVDELARIGSVRLYKVGGREYLEIPSWLDHQRPHPKEIASSHPPGIRGEFKHESSMNQAWATPGSKDEPSTHGSDPPDTDTDTESNTESGAVLFARERARTDADEEAGGIDISEIRQRLGMPHCVPPIAQPKWLGISRQSPDEVFALLDWAAGTDRPGQSFSNCFDKSGQIVAKRREKKDANDYTADSLWAEIQAEDAARAAEEAACEG